MASEEVVIIGAGQAGYWTAKSLRDRGFSGTVTLVGEEAHPPYERPPLSKEMLYGEMAADKAYFASIEALGSQNIAFLADSRARSIDRDARLVHLEDGRTMRFDTLVLATGGRARPLAIAGIDAADVHYLRSIADLAVLRDALARRMPLLIVGGGWIGLETAAAARKLGLSVVLVEAGAQLCGRMLPPEAADVLLRLHRTHGVDVRLGCVVESATPNTARLSTGEVLPCGTIVAGIGMLPNAELAAAAALDVEDGILVDAHGRTSDRAILAAGDVARFPSGLYGGSMRLESWHNAMSQGIMLARTIMDDPLPYDPVPWFWSDQFDVNVQIVGLPSPRHRMVMRGHAQEGDGSFLYFADDVLSAAISFGQPRDARMLRRMVEQRKPLDASKLWDPTQDLQRLARGA